MSKSLNKPNGNLRGVKGFIEVDIDKYESVSPHGWVIWDEKNTHKFNIHFLYTDKLNIELEFSREALLRMIEAIDIKEQTKARELLGPDYDYLDETL